MFSSNMYSLFSVILFISISRSCTADMLAQAPPHLHLYSPGVLEFADVLVKRIGDNLTLECEMRGDAAPVYVWNYVPHDGARPERTYTIENNGSSSSRLLKPSLTAADSGRYVCSAPPFSQAKYIMVQPYPPPNMSCAHDAFVCDRRCVLPAYVCDGHRDCLLGEDEAPELCGAMPCAKADRLNCSSGRCIPSAACCRAAHALCQQPSCCDEHRYGPRAYVDADMPQLFEDRRASDDYGFIQSTIYTVTACALIFMIAVVLLVSAICKMHMKRAALRSYAHADRHTRAHYNMHYAQRHRFPPCYEASGLLEQHAAHSPLPSPTHHDDQCEGSPRSASPAGSERRTRLAALTNVFTSRYRQVPTQCADIEMTAVTSSAARSPARSPRRRSLQYRSPAGAPPGDGAPALNAPQPPLPARLTLQLGRFQLSIPRFGRPEPRPDTPNVAEINIDDLDFVRLNSNETYTLNGRTIRLLGGNFENYPPLARGSHPPPYNEAMRYKLYGPPPEYLSRDRLNRTTSVDEEARSNVEMPPCYDELAGGGSNDNDNGNGSGSNDASLDAAGAHNSIVMDRNLIIMSNILERVCNDTVGRSNGDGASSSAVVDNDSVATSSAKNDNIVLTEVDDENVNNNGNLIKSSQSNDNSHITTNKHNDSALFNDNDNVETLSSVIDNLPAIDSDVNANDNAVAVGC